MTNFQINVISDTVCPWCYVGKRRLDRAIAMYKRTYPGGSNDTFTVTWHAFYLDSSAPLPGIPLQERMLQRFGNDPVRVVAMQERLRNIGLSEGIRFSFDGRIGRTRDSHRLIALALRLGGVEMQGKVVDELFRRYFEGTDGTGHGGIDITSLTDLSAAGAAAGLGGGNAEEVRRLLEGKEGDAAGKAVDAEVKRAVTELGVRGVPFFEIKAGQGEAEVDGAQDVPVFLEAFTRIKAMEGGGSMVAG